DTDDNLSHDLEYINSNWDTHVEYYISSHRPIIGTFLVCGRQIVHGEIRRYVDLIVGKQTEFNAHIVHLMNKLSGRFEKLDNKVSSEIESVSQNVQELDNKVSSEIQSVSQNVQELDNKVSSEIELVSQNVQELDNKVSSEIQSVSQNVQELDNKVSSEIQSVSQNVQELDNKVSSEIESVSQNVQELDNKVSSEIESVSQNVQELKSKTTTIVDEKVTNVFEIINADLENKAWLANLLDNKIQDRLEFIPPTDADEVMNYFLFEEKYRGSTEDIKQRQSIFLEHFKNCQKVLDIGCGRGEFLSLLKENGIGGTGIDLNEDMILYCQKNGLDVSQGNALTYLQSLKDKSLDGVFSGQVVEHLQPDELISLVKLCYDKMKFGTYFVAETVNPTCLSVFANSFYMDLSHVKPVHPATIKFLMESVGFRDVEFKFFSPHPDEAKLEKFEVGDGMDDVGRRQLEVMNANIDKLNGLLYGYQDYAVIGKK
ncbi:MAG: methyltransferase domain-containing protein, partial [Desulfobacula sp.]|nr:methyltransferase domain-containing protein [Desulfobacula sp.]